MTGNQELMTVISGNIKLLFDSRPGSRIGFARENFISPSVVTKWCGGKCTDIGICDVYRIAAYFGVEMNWMVTDHRTLQARAYAYNQV